MANVINRAQANELWTEVLTKNGKGWLTVLTGSMAPLIHSGDTVLITNVSADRLANGNIAVFKREAEIIVHRILKRFDSTGKTYFLEKGDNTYVSGIVMADDIIGKVMAVKSDNRLLNLDSRSGQFAGSVLSKWFYLTTLVMTKFNRSTHKNMRRIGRVLSPAGLFISFVLVKTFCIPLRSNLEAERL